MNHANQFLELEIRIHPRRDEVHPVEIALAGQRHFRGHLSASILPWISSSDPVEDGRKLFQALFTDRGLRDAWAEARGQSLCRRIRIHIDEDSPELHALPWELLREEATMLSADARTPFSRYLAVSKSWGEAVTGRPIRVLVVISNPHDLEEYNLVQLNGELERSILEQTLSDLDKSGEHAIRLHFLDRLATMERLEARLQEGYHVLHYLGHGMFNKHAHRAFLYMQDERGNTQPVRDEEFIGMLSRQRARPRLVFLAACQSATRSTANAFLGLGPRLVAAGVPAVVAMQGQVAIPTARKLSLTFYKRLAEHGMVDCALNQARSTLLTAGRPDAAVPVLFMRLKSGQLWEDMAAQAEEAFPRDSTAKYNIHIKDSQVGVIGDGTKVEGGIHFGKSKR